MNLNWSLDELYTGFDSKEFKSDMESFKKFTEEFIKWAEENLASPEDADNKIKNYIALENELDQYSMLGTYCSLTLSVESENLQALKNINQIENISAELSKPSVMFREFIKEVENLDEIIERNPELKEYEFFLNEVKSESKYLLTKEEEVLLSKLKITGSGAWGKLYDQVISTATADYEEDGEVKKLNIPSIRNLSSHKDVKVRKKAFEAELKCYEKIDKTVASVLNAIKGEAITVAKARGYESVLDMTLKDSRLEKEILDAMFEAIRESLPVFWKYYQHKGSLLGDENGIKYYNINAPVGNVHIDLNYQEAMEYVVENFTKFSEKMGNYAKNAYEKRWIDVMPKEGKVSGAFCAGVHPIKESRIMTNFSDGFDSMLTLAHELGHGYHGECMKDLSSLNCNVPMPLAETASTFCETLVCREAMKTASDEEKLFILDNSISGVAQVIVDIYSRFLFEDELIKKRETETLSSEELKDIMSKAIIEAYGEGIDKDVIHPYMWICKPHYYDADLNYYNFPYAYGQLFAYGLYMMYMEEGDDFVKKYDKILEATGSNTLREVGIICGVDVTDKNFWKKCLKVAEDNINEFIKLK